LKETATPKYPNYKPAVKLGAYFEAYDAPATYSPPTPNPARI